MARSRTPRTVGDDSTPRWDDELAGSNFEPDHDHEHEHGTMLEVVVTIVAALVLAFGVQQFLVKPFKIPSGSMENTLHCGDRVLVNRLTYRFGDPKRGDVVVFHPPAGIGDGGKPDPTVVADSEEQSAAPDAQGKVASTAADTNYIKRVIGLPGDRFHLVGQHVWINGKKLDEPYLHPIIKRSQADAVASRATWPANGSDITVPKGAYLMLGDHRDDSRDGRFFGFVPRKFLIGKTFMVYWPPKRFGSLPAKDPGGRAARRADPNCLEGGGAPTNG